MYYILSKLSIVVKEKVTHYIVLKSSKISSWCHSNVNANSDTLLIFNSYIKYCLVSRSQGIIVKYSPEKIHTHLRFKFDNL